MHHQALSACDIDSADSAGVMVLNGGDCGSSRITLDEQHAPLNIRQRVHFLRINLVKLQSDWEGIWIALTIAQSEILGRL